MKPILKMKNWQLFRVRGYEGSVDLRDQSFVAIGKRALMGRNNPYLEQVYIPAGASVIKAEAFLGCKNLQTVILSTANNIGLSAGVFQNCHRLHTVANAEKIHSIGANCFACRNQTILRSENYITTYGKEKFKTIEDFILAAKKMIFELVEVKK